MATELTRDAVLSFLYRSGGRVKNADLLAHFWKFLRADDNRTQNRELFKTFVNSVAVVKQDCGVSFVVLRKRYRGQVGDVSVHSSDTQSKKTKPREISPGQDSNRIHKGQTFTPVNLLKSKRHHENEGEHFNPRRNTEIVSSHGIISNVETLRFVNPKPACSSEQTTPTIKGNGFSNSASILEPSSLKSDHKPLNEKRVRSAQHQKRSSARDSVPRVSPPPAVTHCANENVYIAELKESGEVRGVRSLRRPPPYTCSERSFCPPPPYKNNESKVSLPEDLKACKLKERALEPACGSLPLPTKPRKSSSMCSSSSSSNSGLSGAPDALSGYHRKTCSSGSLKRSDETQSGISFLLREDQGASVSITCHSASHDSLLLLSVEYTDWPRSSPPEERVTANLDECEMSVDEQGPSVIQMLHRAEEAKLRCAERRTTDWHGSTGRLGDRDSSTADAAPEDGAHALLRSSARATASDFRNRMCRSLGADLDQAVQEDEISARRSRLSLLSSSLSTNPPHSSPSRAKNDKKLGAADARRASIQSASEGPNVHRTPTTVPLDSKEHTWMVKAAAGTWTNIYALFREEPSLLEKRDFISGYTVLHWIAKHGDHRVLNTLWYGVDKAGMTLDVDVKTTCGYTPLHLAAMHGHKTLVRVLVHKFKANPHVRDSSGKKPWQYLDKNARDLLELLGAPRWKEGGGTLRQTASERLPAKPAGISPTARRRVSVVDFLKSGLKAPAHTDSLAQARGDEP